MRSGYTYINTLKVEEMTMVKSLKTDQFHLGACYYPEHWPETLWQDDYKRMAWNGTVEMEAFGVSILQFI